MAGTPDQRYATGPGLPAVSARAKRGALNWRRGLQAEDAACDALQRRGWSILLRRARTPAGEIDIVAEHPGPDGGGLLAFVEVKTRARLSDAASCVSDAQKGRLLQAGAVLLAQHPQWRHAGIRFDLILADGNGRLRRIADAFRSDV